MSIGRKHWSGHPERIASSPIHSTRAILYHFSPSRTLKSLISLQTRSCVGMRLLAARDETRSRLDISGRIPRAVPHRTATAMLVRVQGNTNLALGQRSQRRTAAIAGMHITEVNTLRLNTLWSTLEVMPPPVQNAMLHSSGVIPLCQTLAAVYGGYSVSCLSSSARSTCHFVQACASTVD